ncbi:MAG: triphosphoribosyl-dephospho-CoA synthase [Burkholderiaceae bacterium]|nr:MAG: triphosphoribosyl-dephospho-CoA synthase [Burkholderiaceae bacterium]
MDYLGLLKRNFLIACQLDVQTLKPGNVSFNSSGFGMTGQDFINSSKACAPLLVQPGLELGEKIYLATKESIKATGCNTNLGIILLCAPVLHVMQKLAEEEFRRLVNPLAYLQAELMKTINEIDLNQSKLIYDAIVHANPGGLGEDKEMDVRFTNVKIIDAMRQAKDKDFIAKQYFSGFFEILKQPVLQENFRRQWINKERPINPCGRQSLASLIYFYWLTNIRDSHIQRKFGLRVAEFVKKKAIKVFQGQINFENVLNKVNNGKIRLPNRSRIRQFDEFLKVRGLNPGTSADITVCSLLIFGLLEPDYSA